MEEKQNTAVDQAIPQALTGLLQNDDYAKSVRDFIGNTYLQHGPDAFPHVRQYSRNALAVLMNHCGNVAQQLNQLFDAQQRSLEQINKEVATISSVSYERERW